MFNSVPSEEVYRKLLHGFVIVLPFRGFLRPKYFCGGTVVFFIPFIGNAFVLLTYRVYSFSLPSIRSVVFGNFWIDASGGRKNTNKWSNLYGWSHFSMCMVEYYQRKFCGLFMSVAYPFYFGRCCSCSGG